MCPLTCKIVKQAIKAHEERGVIMQEFVECHKVNSDYCAKCTRNNKAVEPERDMGVAG